MPTGHLTTHSSFLDYADLLRHRQSFNTHGALYGRPGPATGVGMLPAEWHGSAGGATYVVYSYQTPIAWIDSAGRWVQPDTQYSVTTSRHQSKIATAISVL